MAELNRLKASEGVDPITKELRENGAVIVEDLIDSDTIARLNDELEAHIQAANPGMAHLNPGISAFFGDKTRHVSGVAGKSRSFAVDVMCHPLLLDVCDQILLPSCARYQLNLGHVIDRGPGGDQQWLHRDELVWVHMARPHPELQIATMIPLIDFTRENGATAIVPGSHLWPYEREAEPEELGYAEMRAGSAAIYLGSTIHAGGANSTADVWRRGLHMSYVLGWLRTEENNYLACPPEVARTLPRKAQELIGYAVHDAIANQGGYLGMLGMRDPIDLFDEGAL